LVAISEDEEQELRMAVMQADLKLKQKQAFWETPRNIALLLGVAVGVAGVLGFKLGQNTPPMQIIFQPGSIVVAPAAAPLVPAK